MPERVDHRPDSMRIHIGLFPTRVGTLHTHPANQRTWKDIRWDKSLLTNDRH